MPVNPLVLSPSPAVSLSRTVLLCTHASGATSLLRVHPVASLPCIAALSHCVPLVCRLLAALQRCPLALCSSCAVSLLWRLLLYRRPLRWPPHVFPLASPLSCATLSLYLMLSLSCMALAPVVMHSLVCMLSPYARFSLPRVPLLCMLCCTASPLGGICAFTRAIRFLFACLVLCLWSAIMLCGLPGLVTCTRATAWAGLARSHLWLTRCSFSSSRSMYHI